MLIINLLLAFVLQAPSAPPAPPQPVVAGLNDGVQLRFRNSEFSGFIDGLNGDAVLLYRKEKFHGALSVKNVSRIDFSEYREGRPFSLTVTLKNGQKLEVEAEHRDYVTLKGDTDIGLVTIKHPDPTSSVVKLTKKKPNRRKDLTIQYLEFPPS